MNDVIWNKKNPMPNFRGTRFTNAHETLIWASKSEKSKYTFNYQSLKCLNDDLQMRSNWDLPICNGSERLKKNGKKVHSTQKPEALLHRILLATSNKNDLVLDPFLGSGTTATVAKKLGRNYYGIEREKAYFKAAEQRLKNTKPFEDGLEFIKFGGHILSSAEDDLGGWFGWPNLIMKSTGGYLGLASKSDIESEMRVVDLYRRDGDKIAENWIFIDHLHFLKILGIDLLERNKTISNT